MDEKNSKNPFLALSVATVLFASLGVIVYTQAPFKKTRPAVQEMAEPAEKIRARLWQDPFQAVLDGVKAAEAKGTAAAPRKSRKAGPGATAAGLDLTAPPQPQALAGKIKDLRDEIQDKFKRKKTVFVLSVMVPGGPYDDNREFRTRTRYAVLAGLNVLGFYPDDPTHIDYLPLRSPGADNQPVNPPLSLVNIIPYEWLVSNNHQQQILLLWLNEDSCKKTPLSKLENLRNALQLSAKFFKVIGPATSTNLLDMIEEGKETDLAIYSATATADDEILLEEAEADLGSKVDPVKFLGKIQRTILTDRVLAQELMRELRRRQVFFGGRKPAHLALVAEWDTVYGRSLGKIFGDELKIDTKGDIPWVHRFSYLRGIDGKLPGESNGDARDKKKDDAGNKEERDVKKLEEAEGKGQYDYLRRLAERIGRLDDELARRGEGPIKAIGVLGSDFYDKFLVLQALGQRFPDRLFFTTDLDARYLHPANLEWTRNLVVASSFGLQLHEDLQGDVPPFRDSYQTSIFWATLRAFYPLGGQALKPAMVLKMKDENQPVPLIFEIGRHNAIDLTVAANPAAASVPLNRIPSLQSFPDIGWPRFVAILAMLSVLALLFWLGCCWDLRKTTLKASLRAFGKKFFPYAVAVAAASLIIVLFNWLISADPSEEPVYFTEGVSIWPTALIRFSALVLSWLLIRQAHKSLRQNAAEINQAFSLDDSSTTDARDVSVNGVWQKYLALGKGKKRYLIIFLIVLGYFLLSFLIIKTFGWPTSPVRGDKSWKIDRGILLLTIFSFLCLTFYVLDAIMLCQRFIAQFYGKAPQWHADSLDHFLLEWSKEEEPSKWMGNRAKEALSNWMLIHLVARRTEAVGKLIFFPFIVWFLVFISRNYYFDNWRTPLGLAIVISMSAVLAWACAVYLRRSAEKLRGQVAGSLAQQMMGAYASEPPNENDGKRLKYVLDAVKDIKTGAFASYLQQPALQSLLVPLGGVSVTKLLEVLTKLG